MGKPNKFELAMRSTGLTKTKVSNDLGFSSYYPLKDRIEDPGLFRLSELRKLYEESSDTGRELISSGVNDYFLRPGD